MSELHRFIIARNWMKSNEDFLTTWHAHVGYKLDLFKCLEKSKSVEQVAKECELNIALLERWVEVGIEVGHLKKGLAGKVKAKKKMVKYASADSPESVGILLREMMELHIPTLLKYPELLKTNERLTYLEDSFADIVAQTSTLLEKAAVPPILRWIKKEKPTSIIDLGCGYGGYLNSIHTKFPKIELHGVEINTELAAKANENLGKDVTISEGDMMEYIKNFQGKVDMVMAHNFLYYFPEDKRMDLFRNISNVMKKDGIVTFISPMMKAKYGQSFTSAFNAFMTAHENLYSLPTLDEIKENGKRVGLTLKDAKPLIKEGGWYLVTMKKMK
ncbi:class I SAM-dependent methyltransferase [Salipaludibacillus daqingensis]|uniref:class I SAM-dependent methyltransferase n=1 Tax=Salipaludibacillus daqingensis TaxID=3041001 RepID=UPI002472EA64|nr:class I SAM-dependent methyltransferase [Salipaludibacillus daqingensis]